MKGTCSECGTDLDSQLLDTIFRRLMFAIVGGGMGIFFGWMLIKWLLAL